MLLELAHATISGGNRANLIIQRRELLGELITGDETRHETLIITEERKANNRSDGDG